AAEDLGGIRPDVPESLQDERAARWSGAAFGEPLLDAVREPLSSGLDAALGSADARILPGDHAAELVPLPFAVGVLAEQQPHDGAVGSDVRRGDVEVRPDQRLEPVHVTERQRLQLLGAEALRIDLDPAFAAPERHVGDGGLPGHLRCEYFEEIERDVLMEARAALVRAARLVVLHAVGLEALRPPRDHLVEALAPEADHAVSHGQVRADQRAAL